VPLLSPAVLVLVLALAAAHRAQLKLAHPAPLTVRNPAGADRRHKLRSKDDVSIADICGGQPTGGQSSLSRRPVECTGGNQGGCSSRWFVVQRFEFKAWRRGGYDQAKGRRLVLRRVDRRITPGTAYFANDGPGGAEGPHGHVQARCTTHALLEPRNEIWNLL
jgi:hypothetical protein